jgi:superfamily II DNA or RNA helicase
MYMIEIITPSKAYVTDDLLPKIEKFLSYKNKSREYEYNRIKNNKWFKKNDPEKYEQALEDIKKKIQCSLIFRDDNMAYIRSGSIPYLIEEGLIQESEVVNKIQYPKMRPYRWYNKLPFNLYDYQTASVEKLIQEKHGCVSLCTGSGKFAILLKLCQTVGLRTIISVPSENLFTSSLKEFEHYFGKDSVGCIGDGKKRLGKLFTVCIADSLSSMKPDSEAYEFVKSAQCVIIDESHQYAAETLETVCHGPLADIPYRFFLSGTQVRGDGTQKLLQSIIGKCVHSLSTAEAIAGGYVCDHEFRIVKVKSSYAGNPSRDPLTNKRNYFTKNTNIRDFVAKLANVAWNAKKMQTLVLVKELWQIIALAQKMQVPFAVATSTTDSATILSVLLEKDISVIKKDLDFYLKGLSEDQKRIFDLLKNSEPSESVKEFNEGKARVLIGTTAVSTGTNIFPTHNTVNWQGGSSETETKQGAVGRSVRLLEKSKYAKYHEVPKNKAIIWDFDVEGAPDINNHLFQRLRYYRDSGVDIKEIG